MKENSQDPKKFFSSLQLLKRSLIVGQILFALIAVFIQKSFVLSIDFQNDVWIILVVVYSLSALMGSQILYRSLMQKTHQAMDTFIKLEKFRMAYILRMAIIESASIMAIVVYIISNNFFHLFIAAFLIINMFAFNPNIERFVHDSLPKKP